MATNFPTGVDTFTNPVSNDSLNSPSHSVQHADANDAIEAIEGYILNGTGAAWQTWAPVLGAGWSNTTGGAGTWSAFYTQIGKTVIVYGQYTLGAAGNAGANLQLTLPVAGTRTGIMFTGRASIAGSNYLLSGRTVTGSVMSLEVINAASTYTTLAQLNTTVPGTWATGSSFTFSLTYEAA
jgi:hypothetical protein